MSVSEASRVRLVFVETEHETPYERPRLSKDYLRRDAGRWRVYVHGEGFSDADHELELHRAERRST